MFENIRCDNIHKHILIPSKEIIRKLKMLAAIASLSALAITSFSGCDVIKSGLEELEKTTRTNYTQEAEESSQEHTERSYIQEMKKQCSNSKVYTDNFSNEDRNDLLTELNDVIKEKNFPEEINLLLIDTFESLCKNYSSWQNGYMDMPSTKEYIKNNFIEVIKKVTEIEFVDKQSEEGKRLAENGESYGTTYLLEGDNLLVQIIADRKEVASPTDRMDDIEIFFHEIEHVKQDCGVYYSDDYYELEPIMREGGATYHEKFTKEYTTYSLGSNFIRNSDESMEINYKKDNGIGYHKELNAYEKLVFLLGYDCINDITTGKIPFKELKSEFAKYYGEDYSEEFLGTMRDWYVKSNETWGNDEVFQLSIKLENLFLEIIGKNVQEIDNIEQLNTYKQMIEQYIERNMPFIVDSQNNDITSKLLNYQHVYKLITEKEKSLGPQKSMQDFDDYEIG